ncbi:MAG: response regulator [Verrucomicrobiia bacterium]
MRRFNSDPPPPISEPSLSVCRQRGHCQRASFLTSDLGPLPTLSSQPFSCHKNVRQRRVALPIRCAAIHGAPRKSSGFSSVLAKVRAIFGRCYGVYNAPRPMSPKHILFVDDEPDVFQELEQSLQPMRDEWRMRFAPSGSEALKILSREPFDAVVSDMLMPEMNGSQFLTEIKTRHSQMMRLALMGDSEPEAVLRLSCPAHQCLSKPLNPIQLRNTIKRTLALRDLLTNQKLRHMVSQVQSLPGLPSLYVELIGELQKEDPSITRVSEIISRDMGMTCKILHVVNSVFYSLSQKITDPSDAAMHLGLETLKSLVLTYQLFSQFPHQPIQEFSLEALWQHCWNVGVFTKQIAAVEKMSYDTMDLCFTAALLHDIGKLILASHLPDEYREIMAQARQKRVAVWKVEQEILGATHAEVGAYLLSLWGLPHPIVEGVAFHHCPIRCTSQNAPFITIIHAADSFEHENRSSSPMTERFMMMDDTVRSETLDRIKDWQAACLWNEGSAWLEI